MTDVGASLALRRQKKLFSAEEGTMKKRQRVRSKRRRKRYEDKKPPNTSWQIFVEGAALYASCLILPSVFGVVMKCYKGIWEEEGIFRRVALQSCSLSMMSRLQWCIQNVAAFEESPNTSSLTDALAPDADVSDFAIVGLLSLSMAIIRLLLVHYLIPDYNQPKRLEALVRCKSLHLLSSPDPGTVTPRSASSFKMKTMDFSEAAMLPTLPPLGGDVGESPKSLQTKSPVEPRNLFAEINGTNNPTDEPDEKKDDHTHDLAGWKIEKDDDSLSDEDHQGSADHDDYASSPPLAVSSGLLTSSSAQNIQALLEQAAPMKSRRTPSRRTSYEGEADRIFAAPKYATAVFRLFFCTVSCLIALIFFNHADFWPPAVGGSGSTKNCWDLSSVGAAVMDSDFDQHNTVLRRYFLLQASYHFHSGAFHILAALLLWFVSSSSKNNETFFLRYGIWTIQNAQSLFQHCFAVGLIAGTYLFSSMRRLGAIGMFTFDMSSWFLHLLQLCINSPYGSRRINPTWVRFLHRGLVIPSFCFSRFYVFPFVIGYSALEESQDWLRQLENMLFPGFAKYIHGMFVVSYILLIIMNIVYFRRLIKHPQVRDALTCAE